MYHLLLLSCHNRTEQLQQRPDSPEKPKVLSDYLQKRLIDHQGLTIQGLSPEFSPPETILTRHHVIFFSQLD
jgi:hypothetical protein